MRFIRAVHSGPAGHEHGKIALQLFERRPAAGMAVQILEDGELKTEECLQVGSNTARRWEEPRTRLVAIV
jgi:hypothetical protein